MGTKYFRVNEDGVIVQGRTTDAVRLETKRDRKDGRVSREIRTKEMTILIHGQSAPFDLTLFMCTLGGKPLENPTQWNTHERDQMFNIDMGEFAKLKDAENFALRFAYEYRDYGRFFIYDPVFDKLATQTECKEMKISEIPVLWRFNRDDKNYHGVRIQIPYSQIDKEVLEKEKEETRRRLELREKIKNGGEDTRIMVKVLLNVDLGDLAEAIQNKLSEEIDQIDGVGADGTSIYNVDDVVVDVKNTGEVEATFYLERESGKFASADELRQSIADSIGDTEIELPITVTE